MSLDAGSYRQTAEIAVAFYNGHMATAEVFAPWRDWVPTEILHHGSSCCEINREWVAAADFAVLNGGNLLMGPRWLRQRFEWGPSVHPMYWCEVLDTDVLDCGIHAALAHEVFSARGIQSFRTQLVQQFSHEAAAQWRLTWEDGDAPTLWIDGDLIYHEGCAIVTPGGGLKMWDPSAGWWLHPQTTSGYGSLRAVRITVPDGMGELRWDTHVLPPNAWNELG